MMRHAKCHWIVAALALTCGAGGASAQGLSPGAAATTQGIANSAAYNSGFSMTPGGENQPADGQVRDGNGNLIIVNGVMSGASAFSRTDGMHQTGAGFANGGTATAIGNSLNVTVLGSWNTVIVDSEQVNNGDQNAEAGLNGELKL